jgi:mono/diheme cytochrome c family protein
MRENLAKAAAVMIGVLAVLGALTFATRLNPRADPGALPASAPVGGARAPLPVESVDPSEAARGRALFADQGCTRCHAAEGAGNPRSPLDGVGGRYTRAELRDWIIAAPSVRRQLSGSAARAKEGYAGLAPDDLDALTGYLSTLR